MQYFDDRLKELNDNRLRLKQLEAMLKQLDVRRRELVIQEYKLKQEMEREQADVERLEGHPLTALFYALTGKKEERLRLEQAEAYRAAVQHEAAEKELDYVRDEIRKCRQEMDALQCSDAEYEKLLAEKTAAVMAGHSPLAQKILSIEARIDGQAYAEREIREAIAAGKKLNEILQVLKRDYTEARAMCTLDMFINRYSTYRQKYAWLENIEENVDALREQLVCFERELADVGLEDTELRVDMESFDSFIRHRWIEFSGTNLMLRSQLSAGLAQVEEFDAGLGRIMQELENMLGIATRKQDRLREECRTLITGGEDIRRG